MIKKGDTVIVRTGVNRGKKGKVVRVFPKLGKAVVEGVNIKKRHKRATSRGSKGSIVEIAHPISISNIAKA